MLELISHYCYVDVGQRYMKTIT